MWPRSFIIITSYCSRDPDLQTWANKQCSPIQMSPNLPGGPISDTPVNYVNIMSCKLQNIEYLYRLNNFNTSIN